MENSAVEPHVDATISGETMVVETPSEVSDKAIPQEQVNRIAGNVRQQSYEKGYAKALADLQANQAPSVDVDSVVDQKIQKLLADQEAEEAKKQQEAMVHGFVQDLTTKIAPAKEKYPDFEEVVGAMNYGQEAPEILVAANEFDNPGDILFHLSKNPEKLGAIRALNPSAQAVQLKKLAKTLKDSEAAESLEMPNEPLSQVQPSNVGRDSGKLSRADLRKKWRT